MDDTASVTTIYILVSMWENCIGLTVDLCYSATHIPHLFCTMVCIENVRSQLSLIRWVFPSGMLSQLS